MELKTVKVGKMGEVIIPARLRRRYGLNEGSLIIAEALGEGVFLRPAVIFPVEIYTPQRKAEFLLNNAISEKDYLWAVQQIKKLEVDPEKISHPKPKAKLKDKRIKHGRGDRS